MEKKRRRKEEILVCVVAENGKWKKNERGIRKVGDVIKNGKKFYRVECWKEQVWESFCVRKGCFGVGVVPALMLFVFMRLPVRFYSNPLSLSLIPSPSSSPPPPPPTTDHPSTTTLTCP